MPSNLHWTDKLRIERFVRSVDGHLGDLPGKVRSGHRGDLRANLTAACADGDSRAAIARMGSPRSLALEFLEAEYGHGTRRPSWLMAATFFVATYLFMYWLLETGTAAFAAGLTTADLHTTGDYRWDAVPYLLSHVSMSFADGRLVDTHGGAWTPLTYLVALGGALLAGRLWRLLPAWRRRATTA